MSDPVRWSLCITAAYLLGSIPFGLLIGLARGVDIRQHGSKNIGATNTGRVLGGRWGKLCFLLDFAKGALPVLGAGWWMGVLDRGGLSPTAACLWLLVGIAALLGHVFPVYIGFKGGKGVATGFGVMIASWPWVTVPALVALVVWMAVLKATRYVSVSSCIAACSLPVSLVVLHAFGWPSKNWPAAGTFCLASALLAALVIWKHRANIARVRTGSEPKVGGARPAES